MGFLLFCVSDVNYKYTQWYFPLCVVQHFLGSRRRPSLLSNWTPVLCLSMGTNVQLGSPVCIDRSNVTIGGFGGGFMSTNVGDYLQRPSSSSSNKLILSDSGIQLDLF